MHESTDIEPSEPSTVMHLHMLAALHTELTQRAKLDHVRILDVGCGNGELIGYLQRNLTKLHPDTRIEIHGLDVHDYGIQRSGFFERALSELAAAHPDVEWASRLHLISVEEEWPFADNSFDVIVSNQVMEHVHRHDTFLARIRRCLVDGGFSMHVFPLRHYVWEGHLDLPFVHRIKDRDKLVRYIRCLSSLGLGKYGDHMRQYGTQVEQFAQEHADYMLFHTNYLSAAEALEAARRAGLRGSLRYTPDLYRTKLRMVLGLRRRASYTRARFYPSEWLLCALVKYVSSITFFLEKHDVYRAH